VFVSDAIARMGPRSFVLAGLVCLAASIALLAVLDAIWQLFVAYLIMSFAWAGMSVGAITNVLGLWFDHKRGLAISLALVGASVGGMLIVPALVYFVGVIGFGPAMIAASMITLVTQATNPTALTAACAVFGLSIGNITTLPALIIQREFDAKSFGMLIGLATAISQFTYAFGPGLLGVLHDATGSYAASLMVCTVLDVIAAVIVVLR
jgi:predicted MFS family arabinose efflux permease